MTYEHPPELVPLDLQTFAEQHPRAVVGLMIGGAVLLYFGHCAMYPFTSCGWCKGSSGKSRASGFRRVWKNCPRCKGAGRRKRFGAWLLGYRSERRAKAAEGKSRTSWSRMRQRTATFVGLVGVLALVVMLVQNRLSAADAGGPERPSTASASEIRTEAGKARVAPDGGQQGYSRDRFPHWTDADHDQCNTRCEIVAGRRSLVDPYTGQTIAVGAADLDHVVPLAAAWRRGASSWKQDLRQAFANDPGNLLLVSASANRSKGDKSLSEWLPVEGEQCAYTLAFLRVSNHYGLSISAADKTAAERVARTC